jgi:hypothetical protein
MTDATATGTARDRRPRPPADADELAIRIRLACDEAARHRARLARALIIGDELRAAARRRRAAIRATLSRPATVPPPPSPESRAGGVASVDLRRQLATLPVIEQAKGIYMAECHCDEKAAFALLRQRSQQSNRKLRDVAAEVVGAGTAGPSVAAGRSHPLLPGR